MKKTQAISAFILASMVALQTVTAKEVQTQSANTPQSIDDIEKEMQSLQEKKKSLLNDRQKALDAQQKALEEKEKQLEKEKKEFENTKATRAASEAAAAKQKEKTATTNTKTTQTQAQSNETNTRIIYMEAPNIVYSEELQAAMEAEAKKKTGKTSKPLSGTQALQQSLSDTTIIPEYDEGKLKAFVYKEQNIYQIHCQTYHMTVVQLEPGEQLLENPYLSETSVWKLARGTGLVDGKPTIFLMLKPDTTKLDSTMVIITDKRVYQLQLKSYSDHYMPYVRWAYNDSKQDVTAGGLASKFLLDNNAQPTELHDIIASRSDELSFDYTWKSSSSKTKPVWYPSCVYDDGQSTYIILDKTSINAEQPAIFENKKDIINTEIRENLIIVRKLVKKLTLKLGKEVVTVEKGK